MIFERKGFTLIELLVVMAIIGVLAASLVVSVPKVSQRARDMKCKANLKNIAQATLAYSIQNEHYPHAHPGEYSRPGTLNGQIGVVYDDVKAWVNWTGNGVWRNLSSQRGMMTMPQLNGDLGYDALTNGVLWSFTGKEASTYLCPAYKRTAKREDGITDLWRSYVMNYHFHWHGGSGGFYWHADFTKNMDLSGRGNTIARSAESVLMYAELPMDDIETSGDWGDGKLDPDNHDEYIGFNHTVGKRNIAHVAYADGHVGVLLEPSSESESDLIDLTSQLCNGEEIELSLLRDMH